MKKRYWLRGGSAGIIIGALVDVHFLMQSSCIGLYANPDGTFGTVCPQGSNIFIANLKTVPIYEHLIILAVFFLAFGFLGWLYGKIKK